MVLNLYLNFLLKKYYRLCLYNVLKVCIYMVAHKYTSAIYMYNI